MCHCYDGAVCHADVLIEEFRYWANVGCQYALVGVPWTPVQFAAAALRLAHPFAESSASDDIKKAIFRLVTRSPEDTCRSREAYLRRWEERAEVLESAETALHASLHPDVAIALAGKRILVFREMLQDAGGQKCDCADRPHD